MNRKEKSVCTWKKFLEAFPEEKQAFKEATDDYIDQRLKEYGIWKCRQCQTLNPVEIEFCKWCDAGRHVITDEKDNSKIIPLETKVHLKRKAHGS